jgi:integrase
MGGAKACCSSRGQWCLSCNGNSANAALNKWLKINFSKEAVVHGFRHSFRDRLRAVNCPTEMIDQLGGWSLANVGSRYGTGFGLEQRKSYLNFL